MINGATATKALYHPQWTTERPSGQEQCVYKDPKNFSTCNCFPSNVNFFRDPSFSWIDILHFLLPGFMPEWYPVGLVNVVSFWASQEIFVSEPMQLCSMGKARLVILHKSQELSFHTWAATLYSSTSAPFVKWICKGSSDDKETFSPLWTNTGNGLRW